MLFIGVPCPAPSSVFLPQSFRKKPENGLSSRDMVCRLSQGPASGVDFACSPKPTIVSRMLYKESPIFWRHNLTVFVCSFVAMLSQGIFNVLFQDECLVSTIRKCHTMVNMPSLLVLAELASSKVGLSPCS